MKQEIKTIANIALNIILPPRCVVTGEMVERQGMIAASAWVGLDFINDPKCAKCGTPFGFDADGGEVIAVENAHGAIHCASCIDYPPPYECARAALTYNDQSRDLVLGFKHGDQTHMARAFAPWLKMSAPEFWRDCDVIIPVPLHHWRLLRRRYNQAAIMAKFLSAEVDIPVLYKTLLRKKHTPVQGTLSHKERRENVRHAFVVDDKHRNNIKGKTIVLIDDVYTTGSTVNECTKALLKSGAANVRVLTLVRVLRA